ncbi:MAG: hypothetical protein R3F19_29400 [Verrucomicrobiales bacterium]
MTKAPIFVLPMNPRLSLLGLFLFTPAPLSAQTVFWEPKNGGQILFYCDPEELTGAHRAPNNVNWSQGQVVSPNPCFNDPPIPRATQLSNWTTPGPPSSPTVDVGLLGGGTTELDIDVDVATLTLGLANTLHIRGGQEIHVHAGLIENDGIISIDDRTAFLAQLFINNDTLLAGSGVVRFDSNDDNQIVSVDPAYVLTIGPEQTLLAPAIAKASDRSSRIIASILNNGRITADEGGVQLDTHPKANRSVIEAINGGTIRFHNVSVDNAGGSIQAAAGAQVNLDNATISGGALEGDGVFNVTSNEDATFVGPLTIGPDATVFVNTADNLRISGAITNHGIIRLADAGSFSIALNLIADASLLGTGELLFDSDDDNHITAADPAFTLTVGGQQELRATAVADLGNSRIIARVVNNGTITADGGGLEIQTEPKVNNARMQAINGGTMRFLNVEIDNTAGDIRAEAGSFVRLDGAVVNGGLLSGIGDFQIIDNGPVTFNGPLRVAQGATVTVSTNDLLVLTGAITNNGTLAASDFTSGVARIRASGTVNLDGVGELLFLGDDDCIVDGADAASTLIVGPNQTVTTAPESRADEGRSLLSANTVNNGVVEAHIGGLQLDIGTKTNNGTFRASAGGLLRFDNAGTLLTNFNASTGELSGGRWEAIGAGSTLQLEDITVTCLGAGTEVLISGTGASIPALEELTAIKGSLTLHNGARLALGQSVAISGNIEIGLPDGGAGFDATGLTIDGDVDFTGATIDLSDLGAVDGAYRLASWTGSATGTPTLRHVSDSFAVELTVETEGRELVVDVRQAPQVESFVFDRTTGVVTISYRSVMGEVFAVRGGGTPDAEDVLPDTAEGDGSVMEYRHMPLGNPPQYFYRVLRFPR